MQEGRGGLGDRSRNSADGPDERAAALDVGKVAMIGRRAAPRLPERSLVPEAIEALPWGPLRALAAVVDSAWMESLHKAYSTTTLFRLFSCVRFAKRFVCST